MQSKLTRRERQILEVLYQLGEASAQEVVDGLPDDLANATVRTQLRVLEEKGIVKHRREGKRFIYRPVVPHRKAAMSALRDVLDVFFGGSVEEAFSTHFADPKVRLDDDEIRRLRKLIDQHKRGEK